MPHVRKQRSSGAARGSRLSASGAAFSALLGLYLVFTVGERALAQQPAAAGPDTASAFTTFEVPVANAGTVVFGMDTAGDLAGVYADPAVANYVHGFVRSAQGTFTTFDAPGVAATNGSHDPHGTIPFRFDSAGDVVGFYTDATRASHGFIRAAGGKFTEFDVNGMGTGKYHILIPVGFDNAGEVAGLYMDASEIYRGFVRTSAGTITTFSAPGAGDAADSEQGTSATCINGNGAIAGYYMDSGYAYHGFVRSAGGTFTEFDAPGADNGKRQGTHPTGINAAGEIVGFYTDADGVGHGFLRAANGAMTVFDLPGAGTIGSMLRGTAAFSINAAGTIVGSFTDTDGLWHGFTRSASGAYSSFEVPGAAEGTSIFEGTAAANIDPAGVISGSYSDKSSLIHGFIFNPAALIPTTVKLGASPAASVFGEPVTLTAKVSSSDGAPPNGEDVAFELGAKLLGKHALDAGSSSLTTTLLPVGKDSITAEYSSDSDFGGSTSKALSYTVGKAKSYTKLTAKPNPSALKQAVTLTATVTGQFGGTPTGTVKFFYGFLTHPLITELGTVSLSKGKAELVTTKLPQGNGVLTAEFSGNANFLESTSEQVSMVVTASASTLELNSPLSPSDADRSETLTDANAELTVRSGRMTPIDSGFLY